MEYPMLAFYANDQAIISVSKQANNDLLGNTDNSEHYYRIEIENEGQLLMPLEMEMTYEDGSTERIDLPADIWRSNEITYTRGLSSDKNVVKVELDPDGVFTDIDRDDNVWEAPEVKEAGDAGQ